MRIYVDAHAIDQLKHDDCLSVGAMVFKNGGMVGDKEAIKFIQPPVSNEWQPIDTVAKNGEFVDLWHKGGYRLCKLWWIEATRKFTDGMDIYSPENFTHWMHEPKPPTSDVE